MEKNFMGFCPKPLRIGNLEIDPPVVLAPMAGVTDDVYRRIMAEHGAGLVTTEMVSIEGLLRNHAATWRIATQGHPLSIPVAVQIFGREPRFLAEAAKMIEDNGASLVDVNAGCPVKKVVRQGAGAGLLRDPDRLALIVEEVKKAVRIPVTVKIRLGWDERSRETVELARRLASSGVDAITVHGRTAVQHYSGRADWSWIRKVKESVGIPIIGNGDVTTPELAEEMLRITGCDAVMIGRGSLGNPWLFSSIASRWGRAVQTNAVPEWTDFLETADRHINEFKQKGPRPSGHYRKILMWYSKGCPDASWLRSKLAEIDQPESMLDLFRDWVHEIMAKGLPFLPMKVPEAAFVPAEQGECRLLDKKERVA